MGKILPFSPHFMTISPDNSGMKQVILTLTFILSLVGCQKTTTVTQSALNAGSSCLIGRWSNNKLPLNLAISAEFVSSDDKPNLQLMATQWNNAVSTQLGKNLIVPTFATANVASFASTGQYDDSEMGIYKSYNWFSNVSSNALAITQFFGTVTSAPGLGSYIDLRHADIILNYRDYGSDFTMTNEASYDYDIPTIVLHEMGHFLGLCHKNNVSSVMGAYYLGTTRSLYNYDKQIIKDIYVNGTISALETGKNMNALTSPPGTEVRGIIELRSDGHCVHTINGKKVYEHIVDNFKRKK